MGLHLLLSVLQYEAGRMSLSRFSQKMVNAGGTGVTTTYTYLAGGHGMGSTTPLVQTMTHQGKALTYAYDDAEKILSVNEESKTANYGYDMLGQLIRANEPYDTTAGGAGTTWVYAYGTDVHNQPKIYIENPAESSHISPYICRFTSSLL